MEAGRCPRSNATTLFPASTLPDAKHVDVRKITERKTQRVADLVGTKQSAHPTVLVMITRLVRINFLQ